MTIKWIMYWKPNPGKRPNTQILEEIFQCAESINGVKKGYWKSILNYYRVIVKEKAAQNEFPREFAGISLSDEPCKYFLVIRGQRLVVEAESNMQGIVEKLQSYKILVSIHFEGNLYQLGDFQLRVGKMMLGSEGVIGIMVEMEYLPISSWKNSQGIMGEFFDLWQETVSKKSLAGHFVHNEPNFSEYDLTDLYSPQHTAVQYASVTFQKIEADAKAQPIQAQRN